MKVAITGHTKGIGKALFEYFSQQGYDVIGFSRSNGFDISLKETQNQILKELTSCDIFINNAYVPKAQRDLLISAIDQWNGSAKTIVNIDSKSTLMKTIPPYMEEYVKDKLEQKEIIRERFFKARPHLINFTVGLVDTDMAQVFDSRKIKPNDLAEFIYLLIKFKDKVAVQDVLVEVPDLDWNDIKRL